MIGGDHLPRAAQVGRAGCEWVGAAGENRGRRRTVPPTRWGGGNRDVVDPCHLRQSAIALRRHPAEPDEPAGEFDLTHVAQPVLVQPALEPVEHGDALGPCAYAL